jgi:hypothetical protein
MQTIFASIADAKAFAGSSIPPDQELLIPINSIFTRWRFVLGSVSIDTTEQLVFAPTSSPGSGKWHRSDSFVDLKLPYTYNQANNTTLLTIPAGFRFGVVKTGLEIITQFAGVDTGSIGIDSNVSLNAGGLGLILGNTGTAANTFNGVQGAEVNTPLRSMLKAADVIRHNIITAGYTGGTGFWHVMGALFQT